MPSTQKSLTVIFVDYVPAELRENQVWEIVYYVKNPITQKLERQRNRVKPLKSITLRRKLGKQMVSTINKRLESGWNPLLKSKGVKELKIFTEAINIFIKRIEIEYNDKNLRWDTYKTYRSQISMITKYIEDHLEKPKMMCFEFDMDFIGSYLDYVRYTKQLSARTRDNYLSFCCTLSNFLLNKKYITSNPTEPFQKINKKTKTRIIISKQHCNTIFEYLEFVNKPFLVLCLTCYYCLVRRTEMTKLKVKDINLKNQTLFIISDDSKNRKSAFVTIPNSLFELLQNHISTKNKQDYLFSANSFLAGPKQLNPDMVTKKWRYMRKFLELPKNIHWYSLKDTGITNLLLDGVPLISVRDQARHYSSLQTDAYTPRELRKADSNIKESNIKFR